ncbi:MAG: hypothetical protein HGA75_12575 [Thiobacillus sp.]|nr:hypothetical protein [Thiobacillus sp.]
MAQEAGGKWTADKLYSPNFATVTLSRLDSWQGRIIFSIRSSSYSFAWALIVVLAVSYSAVSNFTLYRPGPGLGILAYLECP